jgi:hypothetical protein
MALMVKTGAGLAKLLIVTAGAFPDVVAGGRTMPTSFGVMSGEDSKSWANDG